MLLVRAGVGWEEGVVGHATVGADLASPAGYALRTGKPVISNHLENEQRFRTPELLVEHGVRRAMNVILQGDGSPFGVLEVDSRSEGEFGEHDIAFLQGAANILGMAIEQQQFQRKLQTALDRHQILLKEVNHRVKNSLQVVSSMLHLQASAVGDPAVKDHLQEASTRISTVGRAYERLAYNADYENIGLVSYLREVIADLAAAVAPCKIQLEAPEEIQFGADRAILVALIINELALNAGKYAYPEFTGRVDLGSGTSDGKKSHPSVSPRRRDWLARRIRNLNEQAPRLSFNQRAGEAVRCGVDTAVHRRWRQFYIALSARSCARQLIGDLGHLLKVTRHAVLRCICLLLSKSGHLALVAEPAKQRGLSRTSAHTAGVCRMTQEVRDGLE